MARVRGRAPDPRRRRAATASRGRKHASRASRSRRRCGSSPTSRWNRYSSTVRAATTNEFDVEEWIDRVAALHPKHVTVTTVAEPPARSGSAPRRCSHARSHRCPTPSADRARRHGAALTKPHEGSGRAKWRPVTSSGGPRASTRQSVDRDHIVAQHAFVEELHPLPGACPRAAAQSDGSCRGRPVPRAPHRCRRRESTKSSSARCSPWSRSEPLGAFAPHASASRSAGTRYDSSQRMWRRSPRAALRLSTRSARTASGLSRTSACERSRGARGRAADPRDRSGSAHGSRWAP
jgi:hypothetical protein